MSKIINPTERKNWIDWMKVIGMFFIVWGHSWPESMCQFIYAFNVPVFFLISGYLSKRESSFKEFFVKNWHNLIIPYLIISIAKRLGSWIGNFGEAETWISLAGILGGFHKVGEIHACTMMWFVATLFFIKILFQWFGKTNRDLIILSIVMVVLSIIWNHSGISLSWGLVNVPLAMPYFLLGYACRRIWSEHFDNVCNKVLQNNKWIILSTAIILFVAVYAISPLNGSGLKMFKGWYGNSLLLATFLGLIGSFAVLLISLLLNGFSSKALRILSTGTIVILGFHRDIAYPIEKLLNGFTPGHWQYDGGTFLISIIVMSAFIPIIWIVSKIFPILLGKRSFN